MLSSIVDNILKISSLVSLLVFICIGNLPISSGIIPNFSNDSQLTSSILTNAPLQINNIFDDLKNDKDLDDVDKRFILKMVRGTLLNKDIKFTEITENKKVEEKYEYWSDKTEYTYFIVKDGTPTMHEIYTIINRKDK